MNSKNSGNAQSQKATEGFQTVALNGSVALGGITTNADTSNAVMKLKVKEVPSLGSLSLVEKMDETVAALDCFSDTADTLHKAMKLGHEEVMFKMEKERADVTPTQAELENIEEQAMPEEFNLEEAIIALFQLNINKPVDAEMLDYTKEHKENAESGAHSQQAKLLPQQVAQHAADQDEMMPLLELQQDLEKLITDVKDLNDCIENFYASIQLKMEKTESMFGLMHESLDNLETSVDLLEKLVQAADYGCESKPK